MLNNKDARVLHPEDQKLLQNLAKRAVGQKVRLSYFERQTINSIPALAKALDENGNFDLSLAANLMTQATPSGRISPNVSLSATYPTAQQPSEKAEKSAESEIAIKATCARHCQKDGRDVQGRTQCPFCNGAGFNKAMMLKADRATGASPNLARHLQDVTPDGTNGAKSFVSYKSGLERRSKR